MKLGKYLTALAFGVALLSGSTALAADWWPFTVGSSDTNDPKDAKTIQYTPLEKAEKPWSLCVLFPHLQDSFWLSVNYGIVEEARRLGVKVNVLQAGGYSALPKQISQYDDCLASGADAILISVISEAGVSAKITEGMDKGVVNVAVANVVTDTPVTSRVTVDPREKGFASGEYVKEFMAGKPGKAVAFPGPQGSGWAELYMNGFRDSMAGSNIELLSEMYGEASVPAQLRLVEDALQTYPDVNVIWGGAPTAEAAMGAVVEAGLDDVVIMSSYENQAMLKAVSEGKVIGFVAEYPVLMGRIGVDLAVRALEKKEHAKVVVVTPGVVTEHNVKEIDTTQIFAPEGFQPVFSVK